MLYSRNYGLIVQCLLLLAMFLVGCQGNSAVLKKNRDLLNTGMFQEAADGLEPLIETDPEDAEARILLAKAYNALGRYTDAVEQLRKASQLYATDPETLAATRLELARTYLKFGDRDSAFR
ncbi:MAG: tetratricopeptide repeat protein, partial [Candidatus Poribacteria bacterium]|nr:tetratricopeptide repeat protein [Candidatus Poribacteria bacterium]